MLINESNYVDKADQAIRMLVKKEQEKNPRGKANIVTTSKLRNLLAMTADIYNQIREFFPDLSIVGWFVSRLGFSTELNGKIIQTF